MTSTQQRDIGQDVLARRKKSYDWRSSNFDLQWERTYKNYLCEADAEVDPNNPDQIDVKQTYLGMPDTWAMIRRLVARSTAQAPNLRYIHKDKTAAELISRSLMWQWDVAGVQSYQKLHVTQAGLMGWSVRPWHWCIDEHVATRRVNLLSENPIPEQVQSVFEQYSKEIEQIAGAPIDQIPPEQIPMIAAQLTAMVGRRGMIPVHKVIRSYDGPKCDFLFVGDCYPQPNFRRIQSSQWFIVDRRRDMTWIEKTARAYPEMAEGLNKLIERYPKGNRLDQGKDGFMGSLRRKLEIAAGYNATQPVDADDPGNLHEWTVIEQHTPGQSPRITYVTVDGDLIGDIEYPYYLEGKIAFTECTLIDSLLSGIGDSTARITRGLVQMHSKQVCQRATVVDRALRPLVFTHDRRLFDDAENALKALSGFRLVYSVHGANAVQIENLAPAMASLSASMADESGLLRMLQMASGESNMSMAADIDPSQMRTATGARLIAHTQDVLSKDVIDAITHTSLKPDAEMMYMLNRSEMPDDGSQEFYAPNYNRNYTEEDSLRGQWVKLSGSLFQLDGTIVAEAGSTMADDDEAKAQAANTRFSLLSGHPDINQRSLAEDVLIAAGKGRDLERYMNPIQEGPPPPEPTKSNLSLKFEMLPPEIQPAMLERLFPGLMETLQQQAPIEQAPMDGGGAPPTAPPPPPPMEEPLLGASSLAAAKGNSPFAETGTPA